jgi:hypothetical protein
LTITTVGILMVSGGSAVRGIHADRISFGQSSYRWFKGALPSVPVWAYQERR